MVNRRVAIIENQSMQFSLIRGYLTSASFEVFPNQNEYTTFLDHVRVFLNKRYSEVRKKNAFDGLLKMLNEFEPELLLIDHMLVGNHNADNGLDLAIKLRKENVTIPILFLSRTDRNQIDVCKKLPEVQQPTDWISKGYTGEEILQKIFFREQVLKKILLFLDKSREDKIREELDVMLKYFEELHKIHKESNSRFQLPQKAKGLKLLVELIESLKLSLNIDKSVLSEITMTYKAIVESTEVAGFGEASWVSLIELLISKLKKN
ncbi:hypothetical protein [Pedobacter deserti]|uniref:hypothetical protein n=1 Tax=Pedobacter deserti TaxID=2817382 RepID=UPI00210AE1AE|nr:hypothetical protein [Pedobacter sp. SYSU D00382]